MKPEQAKEENTIFHKVLKHKKFLLCSLLIIFLAIPAIKNVISEKPLLMGGESYYHLLQADQHWYYYPLHLALSLLGTQWIILLLLALALSSLLLFLRFTAQIQLPERVSFFIALFTIITPAFIHSFSTLSAVSYVTFLTLLGFTVLTHPKKNIQWLSAIPFVLTTFFDLFSSSVTVVLLALYVYVRRKESRTLPVFLLGAVTLCTLLNFVLLSQPFVLGPFHEQQYTADFISDLGGSSGLGLFLVLLMIIGLMVTWKQPEFAATYVFIPFLIPFYFYSTETIFPIALLASFSATIGFLKLFDRTWTLPTLKKFTLLVIMLGLLFSTLTYLSRITAESPTAQDAEALTWIQENALSDAIILSDPENSYFIQSIAQRTPFAAPHQPAKINFTEQIFSATYIKDLFPLLEQEYINYIYLTPRMKERLPKDQGLRFLLKNERFKLVYSSEDTEIWFFKQNK